MSTVFGNFKTNKLMLQGHGATGSDVIMDVQGDVFQISFGDLPLMRVAPEDIDISAVDKLIDKKSEEYGIETKL